MIGPTTIKVCNADITREDKKLTKMDLYVSINIGKQHYETKVCKNSGPHPEWNETFKVTLAKEKEITVEIWNGALGDDVLIAEGKIAVQDISRTGKGKITWINLFFDRKPAGKMMLEMHSEESEKKQDSKKGQTTTAANGEIDELKQQLKYGFAFY